MHNIHKDTLNFDSHFDDDYYEDIELVYQGNTHEAYSKKPNMLIVTGTSGVGKDTIVDHIIEAFPGIEQVRTATTRVRRYEFTAEAPVKKIEKLKSSLKEADVEEKEKLLDQAEDGGIIVREPHNKYVWMRSREEGESEEGYLNNLIKEYDLVEHDHHYGNLYGVPRKSVEEIIEQGKTPLFRVDVSGAINLNNIFSSEFNIIVVTVLPDKRDDVHSRMAKRKTHKAKQNEFVEVRRSVMREEYSKFNLVTHYYLRNTTLTAGGLEGLERSYKAMRELVDYLGLD